MAMSAAEAAPGDLAVIRGTLEWPPKLGHESFVVVRGDDGRVIYADVATSQRASQDPLAAGRRVSVVGIEGARPWEVQALVLGSGDSAVSHAPSPSAPAAAAEPDWDRVEGVVESASARVLVLTAFDGRQVTIDVSNLNRPGVLVKGDTVKVFGASRGPKDFLAVGFLQTRGGEASALPQGMAQGARWR
jgi:hypothetical protein